MRRIIPVVLACLAAMPVRSEIVENDAMKVFEGKWVQSKNPAQNGILMYLTQERSMAGEYFSIRCEDGNPSVRLAFPRRASGKDVGLTIDGSERRVAADFTGKTKDPNFAKGNVFGYKLVFDDSASQAAFLDSLGAGTMLAIEGQSLPVDLAGAGQAITEQAAYCN